MKKHANLLFIALAAIGLLSCGTPDLKQAEANLSTDSATDSTTRKQAKVLSADVDSNAKLFLLSVINDGKIDVEASNEALQKTKNKEIKALASQIIKTSNQSAREIEALAEEKGLEAPKTLTKEHLKYLMDLKNLTGRAFDVQYVTMMIEKQKTAVRLFTEGTNLTDPELKKFSVKKLPLTWELSKKADTIGETLNLANSGAGDDIQSVSPSN